MKEGPHIAGIAALIGDRARAEILTALLAALRTAFMAMANDAAFRAEAAKLQIDVSPTPGEAVQEFVTRMYGSPKAVIERAKEAISPN